MTNTFCKFGIFNIKNDKTPKELKVIKLRGNMTIQKNNLTIQISDYSSLISLNKTKGFFTSTFKLFDALVIWFTNHNNEPDITFSLKDYMKLCGVSNIRELRSRVQEDLEILQSITISYQDKTKKKSNKYSDIKIIDNQSINNGLIRVHIAQEFDKILKKAPVMPYPTALFKIRSDKFPNAFYILRKIVEHKNMNSNKPSSNTLSLKTLLQISPFIPTIDHVRKSSNPTPYNRIIVPLLRDVHEACRKIEIDDDCKLIYRNAEVLEIEIKKLFYEEIISDTYVRFPEVWPKYPEWKKHEKRITRKKLKVKNNGTAAENS